MNIRQRVTFAEPDGEYSEFFAADMHFHTKHSDTFTRINPILKLAKKRGIHVSITDHNAIQGCLEAARNREGIHVIPGIEVGCREGPHILLYFYTVQDLEEFFVKHIQPAQQKNPSQNTSIDLTRVLELAKAYNCITSIAHPTAPNYFSWAKYLQDKESETKEILKSIDAFEVLCGQSLRRMNEDAILLCQRAGKGFTGGSDGHFLHALGTTITYAEANSVEDFLEVIRKKQNLITGTELGLLPRLYHVSRVGAKHTRYPWGTLECYYRYHIERHLKKIKPKLQRTALIQK